MTRRSVAWFCPPRPRERTSRPGGCPCRSDSPATTRAGQRPLPWSTGGGGLIPLLLFLGLAGLATINVVVPLLILRLATRRRVWGVRLLLALPAVVAIPMAVFLTLLSVTPSMAGASARQAIAGFGLATLGGLPVVVYVVLIGSSLLHRRWWRLVMIGRPERPRDGRAGGLLVAVRSSSDAHDRALHLVRLARR